MGLNGITKAVLYPCLDRKSTRLNSSHLVISYAVFCLKKKKNNTRAASGHGLIWASYSRCAHLRSRLSAFCPVLADACLPSRVKYIYAACAFDTCTHAQSARREPLASDRSHGAQPLYPARVRIPTHVAHPHVGKGPRPRGRTPQLFSNPSDNP